MKTAPTEFVLMLVLCAIHESRYGCFCSLLVSMAREFAPREEAERLVYDAIERLDHARLIAIDHHGLITTGIKTYGPSASQARERAANDFPAE